MTDCGFKVADRCGTSPRKRCRWSWDSVSDAVVSVRNMFYRGCKIRACGDGDYSPHYFQDLSRTVMSRQGMKNTNNATTK